MKLSSYLMVGMLAIMFSLGGKHACYAMTTYTDNESNDSATEAQYCGKNAQTYAQTVSGNNSTYRIVKGTLTGASDEDWYQIYLSCEKTVYLTLNAGNYTVNADIIDSNMKICEQHCYSGLKSENVFKLSINTAGYYYVRIYHDQEVNASYDFTIGNPRYYLSSFTKKFGTQTLPAKGEWTALLELSNNNNIPKDAVGYKISVQGCTSSISSSRYFYNEFYKEWVQTRTGYTYNLPVTDSSRLDQNWKVKYVSAQARQKSFSPEVKIYYVYPELPK